MCIRVYTSLLPSLYIFRTMCHSATVDILVHCTRLKNEDCSHSDHTAEQDQTRYIGCGGRSTTDGRDNEERSCVRSKRQEYPAAAATMGFSFGSFDKICESAALIPCAMLADSTGTGIEPVCYARNVEINGTILFQPGKLTFCPAHSPIPARCLCCCEIANGLSSR